MSNQIDISGDGGVIKEILSPGTKNNEDKPEKGQECVVHYRGILQDGEEFDSSYSRKSPLSFQLGAGQVIKGWDMGVASMTAGETARFTIQPAYAYGKDRAPGIPANSTLQFDIELIEFHDKCKDKHLMTPEEKLQEALESLAKGNDCYSRQDIDKAIMHYLEGTRLFDNFKEFSGDLGPKCVQTQVSLHLNLANCFLQNNAYIDAITHATSVLRLSPDNCKALYRRGVALIHNDELSAAQDDLLKAARIEPQNREIRKQLTIVKERMKEVKEQQKSTFRSMFNRISLYKEPFSIGRISNKFYIFAMILIMIVAHTTFFRRVPVEKQGVVQQTAQQMTNSIVFLDIKIGNKDVQRMQIKLYDKSVPRTTQNFKELCAGTSSSKINSSRKLGYKGSKFHRVIKGFMMQGGDFTRGDGTGGESIYGEEFDDESFVHNHDRRGLISMANKGPNTNGSQFFITFVPTPHLDGRHVVFGEVIAGSSILDEIENAPTDFRDRPTVDITIVDAGVLST